MLYEVITGKVDLHDFARLSMNWLTISGMTWHEGDFTQDNGVSLEDLEKLVSNWLAE